MTYDYTIIFVDALSPERRRCACRQIRELQASMTLPIHKSFSTQCRHGALRSNLLDDLFEVLGKLLSGLGRAVVALRSGEVVGFLKAPIRIPTWLARVMTRLGVRSPQNRESVDRLLAIPSLEIWCVNSMGVKRSDQGRGVPRRLVNLAITQSTRPTIVVTGHEAANLASRRLHESLGLGSPYRVRVLHLNFCVYFVMLNMSMHMGLKDQTLISEI
jgi:hypothetical protein